MKRLFLILAVLGVGCKPDSPAGPNPLPTASPTATPTSSPTPTPTNEPPHFEVRLSPSPPTGVVPFTLNANMCRSYDPELDKLTYEYRWKAGTHKFKDFCRDSYVYTVPGQYQAWFCVKDAYNESICENFVVNVS